MNSNRVELTEIAAAAAKATRRLDPSIDFEFRSGTDISLGLDRYFSDPEAGVLCMSYGITADVVPDLWTPACMPPESIHVLLDHVRRGGKIRGWNVFFEWCVWNKFMVPLYGWPELKLEQCVDSMAEAAALNLPQSLEKCALALNLPEDKLKSKRGKQLIQLLCCPQEEPVVHPREYYKSEGAWKGAQTRYRNWQAKGGRWLNDPALLQELYEYCRQDVVAEVAVSLKLKKLSAYEQRVWVQTQIVNQRGVPVCAEDIRRIVAVADAEAERLNAEMFEVTGGQVSSGMAPGPLVQWVNSTAPFVERTVLVAGDDNAPEQREHKTWEPLLVDAKGETIEKALLRPELYPASVKRALEIRAAVAQTSIAKLRAMLLRIAADGTLKGMYVYHGASTGRDASRGGINLQNLKSPTISNILAALEIILTGDHELARMMYGDRVMDACVSLVRSVIKAPEGYVLYDADFSSVENRFSAWIAGQDDVIELFRQGLDEYKTVASALFRVPYAEVTPAMRKFCKPIVLGGMFGQGWHGMIDYAAGMGVVITPTQSQAATTLYRAKYFRVQASWYRLGDISIDAVRNPGVVFDMGRAEWVDRRGRVHCSLPFNKLKLKVENNFLFMQLPSGRKIAWAAPRIEVKPTPWGQDKEVVTVMQVDSMTHQWRRDKLIGSSTFQSGVQAAARDALIHGSITIEEHGYPVIMRTHDELTALVRKGFGSPDEMGKLMCQPAPWYADLPLAYEAWASDRFKK